MRLPRRGPPFPSLTAAAVSAAINPALTAARVRALMAARWTPTVEDDFPSPTSATRSLATSSAESLGFPSRPQNARNISSAWPYARRVSSEATPSRTRWTSCPTRSSRRSPGCFTGIRAVGFTSRPHFRPPAGFGSGRQVQGEGVADGRPTGIAKAGEGARAPPYIGDTFPRLGPRSCRRRTGRRRTSVILGEIELVGGDHRNRGRGEGGLLELPIEVGPPDFPVAQGVFEVHGAFPGLRGLGKLA